MCHYLIICGVYVHTQTEIERGEAYEVIIQSQGQTEFKRKNLGDLGEEYMGIHCNSLAIFGRHRSFGK